jgi:hypothetical protein
MPELQTALEALLGQVGNVSRGQIGITSHQDILRHRCVRDIYRELGGTLTDPGVRLGRWDVEFDGIAVELDEQLHFNGYRGLTLRSDTYAKLPNFPLVEYRKFCVDYESECMRAGAYGGKWSNASCERQFGRAGDFGDLTGAGAPRWKQRAFYDFVKDTLPLVSSLRVARIAIWDTIQDGDGRRTILEILQKPRVGSAEALAQLSLGRAEAELREVTNSLRRAYKSTS